MNAIQEVGGVKLSLPCLCVSLSLIGIGKGGLRAGVPLCCSFNSHSFWVVHSISVYLCMYAAELMINKIYTRF